MGAVATAATPASAPVVVAPAMAADASPTEARRANAQRLALYAPQPAKIPPDVLLRR